MLSANDFTMGHSKGTNKRRQLHMRCLITEVTFELTMGVVYFNVVEGGNVDVPGNVGRNISHYFTDYADVKQPFQQLFWRTPMRSHV